MVTAKFETCVNSCVLMSVSSWTLLSLKPRDSTQIQSLTPARTLNRLRHFNTRISLPVTLRERIYQRRSIILGFLEPALQRQPLKKTLKISDHTCPRLSG